MSVGAPAMEFSSGRKRWGSVWNTVWASGDLEPRIRVRISGWNITEKKPQGLGDILKLN